MTDNWEETGKSLLDPSSASTDQSCGKNNPTSLRLADDTRVTLHKPDDGHPVIILDDYSHVHHHSLMRIRFVLLISIILYLLDVASDLMLAFDYYTNGDPFYFGMTFAFVIIPFIFTLTISFIHHAEWITKPKLKRLRFYRTIFILILPVSRFVVLYHIFKLLYLSK